MNAAPSLGYVLALEVRIKMNIMEALSLKFSEPIFIHQNPTGVKEALKKLTGLDSGLIIDYLCRFRGPIGSSITGFQILDTIGDEPNIVWSTDFFRRKFLNDKNLIVLSDLVGGSVLIYDCLHDKVYNVNFEGGVNSLAKKRTTSTL